MTEGNEMDTVTIDRAEYEALVQAKEHLDDIEAYDRAMTEREDGLPHEYMVRLIDGETPLTIYREWRGFNQSSLAAASGVNRVQISDIEAGRRGGSVATLAKLAETLRIQIDDLV